MRFARLVRLEAAVTIESALRAALGNFTTRAHVVFSQVIELHPRYDFIVSKHRKYWWCLYTKEYIADIVVGG